MLLGGGGWGGMWGGCERMWGGCGMVREGG